MGTSKGISTPSGGGWTATTTQITKTLNGTVPLKVDQLVGRIVSSAGGLGDSPSGGAAGGGTTGSGGGGGGGGSGAASVGGAVSGLGGFGAAVRDGGLDAAINRLGLNELRGRPAVEVVACVAERLAESADGTQADLVAAALRDAVLECVALESDGTYDDLDSGLQAFLDRSGIEGIIERFLSHFVFNRIWAWVESHATERGGAVSNVQSLASAVQSACRLHVQTLISDLQTEGQFDRVDWFGRQGVQLGQGIVGTLEFRLQALQDEPS